MSPDELEAMGHQRMSAQETLRLNISAQIGFSFRRQQMQATRLTVIGVVMVLTACGPTVENKPGATQAEFDQDSARCNLVARRLSSRSPNAEASPVIGASLGYGVTTAIDEQKIYHDCMAAAGYGTGQNQARSGPQMQPQTETAPSTPLSPPKPSS